MIEDILTLNEIYQEKKVDLNSVDRLGQSVLHFAAKLGFAQVCDFLLKLNVDD
jgi:ankyrin repeat protein